MEYISTSEANKVSYIKEYLAKLSAREAADVSFEQPEVSKTVGDAAFTIRPVYEGTGKAVYASDNASVASVDVNTGKITVRSAGTAKITVMIPENDSDLGESTSYVVTVKDAEKKEDGQKPSGGDKTEKVRRANTITAANLAVEYNTGKKTYAILAAAAGGAKLTYSSNNIKIAVSSTGVITVPAKYIGKAVITIKSAETADYQAASTQISVTVNPKPTSLTSAKNKSSKKMVMKWKKNKDVTGYQLQYSLNKKFASGNKTVTVSKNKTVTKTIKSLKKGKTYYVRIRTYRKVGSTKYYSKWSGVKKVKIAK